MGFFSKKQEKDEQEKQINDVLSHLFKKCPICGTDKFYIMDKLVEGNTIIDMVDYTNGTVGVCPKCGMVAHGHVFCKESDNNKNINYCNLSLLTLRLSIEKSTRIANRKDIDINEITRLLNVEHGNLMASTRENLPDFSKAVDFELFIKRCYEFKYKRKI